MAVQFILGRAGTGKTRLCLDELVEESQRQPLGPPLYWLVPEQATFMCERLLLADGRLGGSFRIKVLGFRGLVRVLAGQLNIPINNALTPIRRSILLADAVESCRSQLTVFRAAAGTAGFINVVDGILRELLQNGHTGESLRELMERQGEGLGKAPGLRDKLTDLSILLSAWQRVCGKDYQDTNVLPGLVADGLAANPQPVAEASIWVDAFSAFNQMEIKLLGALAKTARQVTITLLLDPHSPTFSNEQSPPAGLFARTELMYRRLCRRFNEAGAPRLANRLLSQPHRHRVAPELQKLESVLAGGQTALAAASPLNAAAPRSAISIWSCDSPEAEVISAARYIRREVSQGRLRYRQIGVIVTDLDSYAEIIARVFSAHGIGHFIDRRRSMQHHPLVELISGALAAPLGGYKRQDMLSLLKTGLAGLTAEQANMVENYVLAHGIDADDFSTLWPWTARMHEPDTGFLTAYTQQINAARERFYSGFAPWFKLLAATAPSSAQGGLDSAENGAALHTGMQLATGLIELLERLNVQQYVQEWIADAANRGDQESALAHQQAYAQVMELLSQMQIMMAQRKVSAAAFARLFAMQTQVLTLGLVPPALDQVLVSSVHRSRHPELHTAIVLGAAETQMPQVVPEDAFLSDVQRGAFNAVAPGGEINPGSRQSLLEAPFFDYIALTRASSRLIISYPRSGSDGHRVEESKYIEQIRRTMPQVDVPPIFPAATPLQAANAADIIAAIFQWTGQHVGRRRQTPAIGLSDFGLTAPVAAGLTRWLLENPPPEAAALAQQAFGGWRQTADVMLNAARPYFCNDKPITVSLSQLETYAACPLQHFYKYRLRLLERDTPAIDETSRGLLYHKALEGIFNDVIAGRQPWPPTSEKALNDLVELHLTRVFASVGKDVLHLDAEVAFLKRPMARHLERLMRAQGAWAKVSHFKPKWVEFKFGYADGPPPLQLKLENGDELNVSGKIDRIDLTPGGLALVIDYKTRGRNFDYVAFRAGLNLQLPVYMLALKSQSKPAMAINPAAGLYIGIESRWDGKSGDSGEAEMFEPFRGLFSIEAAEELEPVAGGQRAKSVKHQLTNAGEPHKTASDAVTAQQFDAVLRAAEHQMQVLGFGISQLIIAPAPYRRGATTACQYCDYQAVCPFDRVRGKTRIIEAARKQEVLKVLLTIA
ncbi:MAG: PD-(D/E)XK nuclease family protein [Phycisphaerae bacterium]